MTFEYPWLAGILEGEGSFMLMRGSPCVAVQMSDQDVINKVAGLLGVTVFKQPYKPKGKPTYKPMYGCRVHGKHAIAWMLTLFTFMGERRRAKITEIVKAWKASPRAPRADDGKVTMATCHPHKVVTGGGLCKNCYMLNWRANRHQVTLQGAV